MKVPDQIYDHVYKSGCASKTACQSAGIIGRRDAAEHKRADTFCFSCCNDDFCNRNCSHPHHHTTITTTTTTTTTTPMPTPATCPPDTVERGASCYFFSTDIKYWEEARQICNLKNGALLKIDDSNENAFIIQQLQSMMSSGKIPGDVWGYYMGASLNGAKQWVWTDGSPLNYHDWAPGEPDFPNDQPYGFIFLPGHYAGAYQWGSHKNMQGTSRYICEIPHP